MRTVYLLAASVAVSSTVTFALAGLFLWRAGL
jgi:hypothetical protein